VARVRKSPEMKSARPNRRRLVAAGAATVLVLAAGSWTVAQAAQGHRNQHADGSSRADSHGSTGSAHPNSPSSSTSAPSATRTTEVPESGATAGSATTSTTSSASTTSTTTQPTTTAPTTTTAASGSAATGSVELPPVDGQFDYQIGGAYTPADAVQIVDRDHTAQPAAGKYNICYVNAFQSQSGEKSTWTANGTDLILKDDSGADVEDPDWAGEYFLDTSTAAKRTAIAAVVGEWIDGCAQAGYDAVEPDNLDTYDRSDGLLTKADNVALAALLADRAHAAGLAIAQKNTAELTAADVRTAGFDFAVAEECQVWSECDAYLDNYGDNVIEIEYTDNKTSYYTAACSAQGQDISVILRDRDVVASDKSAYHYESC